MENISHVIETLRKYDDQKKYTGAIDFQHALGTFLGYNYCVKSFEVAIGMMESSLKKPTVDLNKISFDTIKDFLFEKVEKNPSILLLAIIHPQCKQNTFEHRLTLFKFPNDKVFIAQSYRRTEDLHPLVAPTFTEMTNIEEFIKLFQDFIAMKQWKKNTLKIYQQLTGCTRTDLNGIKMQPYLMAVKTQMKSE